MNRFARNITIRKHFADVPGESDENSGDAFSTSQGQSETILPHDIHSALDTDLLSVSNVVSDCNVGSHLCFEFLVSLCL